MLKGWDLLQLFLLLLTTLAAAKLCGLRTGLLAFVTLVLLIPEAASPQWVWPGLLILLALRRVASSRWQGGLLVIEIGYAVFFAAVALPFAMAHIRSGMYPVLAHQPVSDVAANMRLDAEMAPEAADVASDAPAPPLRPSRMQSRQASLKTRRAPKPLPLRRRSR